MTLLRLMATLCKQSINMSITDVFEEKDLKIREN